MRAHVGRFFGRAKQFVRELIVAGSMALNGPEPLDEHDLHQADQQAHTQWAYLDRFRGDVEAATPPELAPAGAPPEPGAMSAAGFAARAEQYAGSTWGASINARRERIKSQGRMKSERRVHAKPMGQHDACGTCEEQSSRGWVPIGTLDPIGDSECKGINCDCFYEYSEKTPTELRKAA